MLDIHRREGDQERMCFQRDELLGASVLRTAAENVIRYNMLCFISILIIIFSLSRDDMQILVRKI